MISSVGLGLERKVTHGATGLAGHPQSLSSDQADPAALPGRRSWTRQRETKGGILEGMVPTCLVSQLRVEPLQTLVSVLAAPILG